jgi:NAD-specific glutamate dehydrogenase
VARSSLREAMYDAHRELAQRVLAETRERDPAKAVQAWREQQAAAAAHARGIVEDIRAQPAVADFASLSVALQALRRLAVAPR